MLVLAHTLPAPPPRAGVIGSPEVRPAAAGAVGFVLTVVFSGGGAIVVDVVVARGPVGTAAGATSSPYQSFTPLRPRHAPFFSALEEYVPSLHIPIVPVGAPAGGGAGGGGGIDDQNALPPSQSFTTVQARFNLLTEMLNVSFAVSEDQRKTLQALPADLQKQMERVSKVTSEQLPALIKALKDAGIEVKTGGNN